MSTDASTRPRDTSSIATNVLVRVVGAALSLAVVYIHLKDQDYFSFGKDPTYLQAAYIVLEIAGVVVALALLARPSGLGWLLAFGVGLGPIVGYVLTRGPGLPDAMDDKGSWTNETLGWVSLVVEGALVLLALPMLARSRRAV